MKFKPGDRVRIKGDYFINEFKGEPFIVKGIYNNRHYICEYIGNEESIVKYLHTCRRYFEEFELELDIIETRKRKLKCLNREIE